MMKLSEEELARLNLGIEELKTIIGDGPFKEKVEALDRILEGCYEGYIYHPHDQRVCAISVAIAERFGLDRLDKIDMESVRLPALLHDIGKIWVLDEEKREERIRHTIYGDYVLRGIGLEGLAIGARSHHERADGKGYPDGLCEDRIELIARIIAFADVYDAMKSNRYYRSVKMTDDVIREELKRVSMLAFDENRLRGYIQEKLDKLGRDEEKLKQKIAYYNRFLENPEYFIGSLQNKNVKELEGIYMKQRLSLEGQLNSEITRGFLELRVEDLRKIRGGYPDLNEIH